MQKGDEGSVGKGVLYIGVDESNHGKFPEVYVAVFSENYSDAMIYSRNLPLRFPKKRKDHLNIFKKVGANNKRDYTFLMFSELDFKITSHKERQGRVIASLIYSPQHKLHCPLNILIDGETTSFQRNYTHDLVSEVLGLEDDLVSVVSGPEFDCRVRIVNFADELAHYFFRRASPEQIATKYADHQRYLIRSA